MRDYARITKTQDGSLAFYSSYDPDLVSALKAQIPWQDRRWLPDEKCWRVTIQYAQTLTDLARDYLGIECDIQPSLLQVSNDPVIEMLKLEYLGTAKDRGSNEPTAYGWVNSGWNAVFPLSVLKSWFAFDDDGRPEAAPTLYAVLGIKRDVSGADLKTAYRRAAKQWHPDICQEPNAVQQFQRIQEAYEVLGNPLQRRKYDAGLIFQAQIKPDASQGMALKHNWWYPPLRCGWVTVRAELGLGRYNVLAIISWQDIERGGKSMVSYWPKGADHFDVKWI